MIEGLELFVPDSSPAAEAVARVTDLGIVAHPDDLEFMAIGAIGECAASDERWFGGIVATDGAGSAHTELLARDELVATRRGEQHEAARLGGYGFVAMLGHSSEHVRSPDGHGELVAQIEAVLRASRPSNVYTHNLADKHATHVAIGTAAVKAVRRLPMEQRPHRMVGVEGWRDLDWLPDHDKVRMDVTRFGVLANELAGLFASQIEGGKQYDLAAEGRRRANATLHEPRQVDDAEQVVVAMDLTPLARNDDVDPVLYVRSAIDRFRNEVESQLARYL